MLGGLRSAVRLQLATAMDVIRRLLKHSLPALRFAVLQILPILISTAALGISWKAYQDTKVKARSDVTVVVSAIGRCAPPADGSFYMDIKVSNTGSNAATLYNYTHLTDGKYYMPQIIQWMTFLGRNAEDLRQCQRRERNDMPVKISAGDHADLTIITAIPSGTEVRRVDGGKGSYVFGVTATYCLFEHGVLLAKEQYLGDVGFDSQDKMAIGVSEFIMSGRVRISSKQDIGCSPSINNLVSVQTLFGERP